MPVVKAKYSSEAIAYSLSCKENKRNYVGVYTKFTLLYPILRYQAFPLDNLLVVRFDFASNVPLLRKVPLAVK